jgi:hypothetical protein
VHVILYNICPRDSPLVQSKPNLAIHLNRQHKMPLLARAPLMRQQVLRTRVTAPARGYHVRQVM